MRRRARFAGIEFRRAFQCLLVFYVFAALFNGERIHDRLRTLPYGPQRDWALRLVEPVRAVSHWTGLGRIRRLVEHRIHGEEYQ